MISEILLWFIAFCMILGAEMVLSTVYLLALAAGALAAALSCVVAKFNSVKQLIKNQLFI